MEIIDLIPTGRDNAIPAADLAKVAAFPDARTLQQEIHSLREHGVVILSATDKPNGYYLPESRQEVEQFVRSMHSRMKNTNIAVKSAELYLSCHND